MRMDQNPNTPFAGRAQHQQRRATIALEESLQQQLRTAHAAGAHLDLEVVIGTGSKCHLRVSTVNDGLLTGIMLVGFRFDSPAPLRRASRNPYLPYHHDRADDRRRVQHLSRPCNRPPSGWGMEVQASELIAALRASGDSLQTDLAGRLWRCQQGREDRRKGIITQWPPMCRSPACPYCRRWLSKIWRSRAAKQLAHADNNFCYLVTIVLAQTGTLDAIRDVVRQLRIDLRNLRDRNARLSQGWRSLEMLGQAEIDAMGPHDIILLPPQRRRVIEALPAFGGPSGYATWDQIVVWVTHVHIACHAPDIGQGDLYKALQRQWPGPVERVEVRAFLEGDAGDNAGRIISYASKHEMRVKLRDHCDIVWPLSVQAAYWGWLHGLRNGLAPLRVRIGRIGDASL